MHTTTQTGITVYDPLPTYTTYVNNSASVTGYTYATTNAPSAVADRRHLYPAGHKR